MKSEVKEEDQSLEDQISSLYDYALANNDPTAALKILRLEGLILERDSKPPQENAAFCDSKPSISEISSDNSSDCTNSGEIIQTESVSAQNSAGSADSGVSENEDMVFEEVDPAYINGPSELKLHQCGECSYKTNIKRYLTLHIKRIHTDRKKHCCSQCSFRTGYKKCLTEHEQAHSGEKPHSCTICTFKTAYKSSLSKHLFVHSKEKPYSCTKCNFKTARRTTLRNHDLKKHTLYACSFVAARIGSLKTHTKTVHPDLKSTKCSFTSALESDLAQHELTHKECQSSSSNLTPGLLKVYKCWYCDYQTDYSGNFKIHKMSHLD